MAKNVVVKVTCDLCGDERDAERSVHFGFDGRGFEIDCCGDHLNEVLGTFERFAGAGRATDDDGGRQRRRTSGRRSGGSSEDLAAIRAWAREQGMQVNDRGRLPASIVEAYRNAS